MTSPARPAHSDRRTRLRKLAEETLDAVSAGSYTSDDGRTYSLLRRTQFSTQNTRYYPPDSAVLSAWSTAPRLVPPGTLSTDISFLEVSTLDGARLLFTQRGRSSDGRIGVLNFASAKKPGGGFLTGAQAQEESLARSSNLYPTLLTEPAQRFYTLHNKDGKGGYYSHAMVFSPGVALVRDDAGAWLPPVEVDVVTSAAVNAGVARNTLWGRTAGQAEETKIARAMKERMGRILFLFEQQGVAELVLGSFGTGVFKNDVATVARIWAELLCAPGARFKNIFDRVLFAIIGHTTFEEFRDAFQAMAAGA
ncbi:hypothetical protein GLOTRDRAFT_76540 [Gloeophyllum trabeum ATCC 11539]|uniref:Microbial-type PARG catalytic domain-containing protein n=1 Tax=Gloeophyllum trabeum (strain ATCC 11539 / FP-39264 / Madison 617) TaxID=670483 RepID=S7Q5A5_GLOTA|nr:uncharacterized protein GLOTRDRAFT_76540 [Gloeophyllum trabeum ATCC 11539]EPQ55221.1 hypothetical protein GLOTRDRAFT_76540 [Gloeophyllum trabeum ATCC 11539]